MFTLYPVYPNRITLFATHSKQNNLGSSRKRFNYTRVENIYNINYIKYFSRVIYYFAMMCNIYTVTQNLSQYEIYMAKFLLLVYIEVFD